MPLDRQCERRAQPDSTTDHEPRAEPTVVAALVAGFVMAVVAPD